MASQHATSICKLFAYFKTRIWDDVVFVCLMSSKNKGGSSVLGYSNY